jgi:ABC-type uncharacterized transport system fused permease/ATPase subunit
MEHPSAIIHCYYFVCGTGTIVTTSLGKKLIGLNFQQLRNEANLRYSLVRLRDNSESIAFYTEEDIEGYTIEQRLNNVVLNRRNINAAQRNLELFTNAYRYMVQILPVAVVAPQYFAGAIELGTISQSAGAFNHILSDLSFIINWFESFSTFSAGVEGLSSFYEAMEQWLMKHFRADVDNVEKRQDIVAVRVLMFQSAGIMDGSVTQSYVNFAFPTI